MWSDKLMTWVDMHTQTMSWNFKLQATDTSGDTFSEQGS